ncbi:RNA-directed RNA polymerase [Trichinella spiralis]|uniref:RNA-directed RNA polymerase n=1 Tax=Trichinella spiralis TaxID=6334 RepID=A0ABR3KV57_TRISP
MWSIYLHDAEEVRFNKKRQLNLKQNHQQIHKQINEDQEVSNKHSRLKRERPKVSASISSIVMRPKA